MSGKKLSTSTMGLRFMQNAQKKILVKEEQLVKAKIKDDAEWEVSREVRESWGKAPKSE